MMAYQHFRLEQFIEREAARFSDVPADVYTIIYGLASASKKLLHTLTSSEARKMAQNILLYNASGDVQHQLDIQAHACFLDALKNTEIVGGVMSEEATEVVDIADNKGEYMVAIDPLDGSANIAVNAPSGTIFSIYRRLSGLNQPIQKEDGLQPGIQQVAAGYMLYSTCTTLVYGTADGVHGFTYEPSIGAFLLTHQAMRFPEKSKSYAVNEGYFNSFSLPIQRYIEICRQQGLVGRYSGTLVADFHRHLLQGGIYLYPSTKNKPHGKLRLMFECNPLAFLAVQAGGWASDGNQSVLTIQPQGIHQCIPFYIGNKGLVERLTDLIQKP
jgi:fructose-1,6-bisphosphatase I